MYESNFDLFKERALRSMVQGSSSNLLKNVQIVGCMMCRQLNEDTAQLGMLAVDLQHQRGGIASNLIQAAENRAINDLNCRESRLEILSP